MANKVISVYRKKYAVGLFWQPAATGTPARIYARNLARGVDRKLNLYTEYHMMVGLGARRAGHRPGMPSAAANIMDAFSEYTSFLAVFQTERAFYLVAARNGIIIEDRLFDTEPAARDAYVALSEIPDWGALFAPSAWGMPRAAERSLSDVLNGASHATLHSISRFRTIMLSVALVVLFVLGLTAVFHDSIKQVFAPKTPIATVDPELQAEYKRQLEEKARELDAQYEIEKAAPPEPIVMPYEILPDPMARAELCYQAIGFVMQPITGWNQTFAECGETHVVAEFRRSFGTLGEFYAAATELMPGAFVSEIDDDTLRVRATLPALPTVASVDERDPDTVLRDITTEFQGMSTNIDTEIVADTLTNGVDVATVNVIEVGAESKLVPMQYMEIFNEFGGVYMTRAAWDVRSRTWNYEVIIYAK